MAIESLYLVLEAYLNKFTEAPETVYERLQTISSHIFPPGKRLVITCPESLDQYVDIICCISSSRLSHLWH